MAKQALLDFLWPMAGLNRRFGYQTQPPYSAADALNVQPDSQGWRQRGGSRQGLGPAFRPQLGGPIRLLHTLEHIERSGYTFWADDFQTVSLGSVWSPASWSAGTLTVNDGLCVAKTAGAVHAVVRADHDPAIDDTNAYLVEMFLVPEGDRQNGTFHLYSRMDAGLDYTANGMSASLTMVGDTGIVTGDLKVYSSSTLQATYPFTSYNTRFAGAGWFTVKIEGEQVTVSFRDYTLLSVDVTGDSIGAGTRWGFGLTPVAGDCSVDSVRCQYDKVGNNQEARRNKLVVSAGGKLYVEKYLGELARVNTSRTLADDRVLSAATRTQKLYIADYSDPKAEYTNGARASFNNRISSPSIADWTTLGISAADDVLVIHSAGAGVTEGVYAIQSVLPNYLQTTTDIFTAATPGSFSFRVIRGPKVYDPATDTLSIWTASSGKGAVPPGNPIITTWRDRVILAGDVSAPQIIYASRQSDPNDFDYGATDSQRAWATPTNLAGQIGEPITALIPHNDVCLLIGCKYSIWIMRGDISYGGQIDNITHQVGVVDKHAWCHTPNYVCVFLSFDGVYMIGEGCQGGPLESFSRERVPAELLNIDPELHHVSMAYDMLNRGIHLYVTRKDGGQMRHWWLDWETRSIWPWQLTTDHEPLVCRSYNSFHADDSAVLLGSRDGQVRRYHRHQNQDDDGTAISSFVLLGPFNLGGGNYFEGLVADLFASLPGDMGRVRYELYVGQSHEEAYRRYQINDHAYCGTWKPGINPSVHPRIRSGAMFMKLIGLDARPWAVEEITARIRNVGRVRHG